MEPAMAPTMPPSPEVPISRSALFPLIPLHRRLFPGIDRFTASLLLEAYPNNSSLSPALESVPATPLEYLEIEERILSLRTDRRAFSESSRKYWMYIAEELNMEARYMEQHYIEIYNDMENMDPMDYPTLDDAEMDLSVKGERLQDYRESMKVNKKDWRKAERRASGLRVGDVDYVLKMEEAEARCAVRHTGLIHVLDLEKRMDKVRGEMEERNWEVYPIRRRKGNRAWNAAGHGEEDVFSTPPEHTGMAHAVGEDGVDFDSDSSSSELDDDVFYDQDEDEDEMDFNGSSEMAVPPALPLSAVGSPWGDEDAEGEPDDEYMPQSTQAYVDILRSIMDLDTGGVGESIDLANCEARRRYDSGVALGA